MSSNVAAKDNQYSDSSLDTLVDKLIQASERSEHSTFSRVIFPDELDETKFIMPENLVSLYSHPIYSTFDYQTRWRLGLLETINFFSMNIHGEQALVASLAGRLYRDRTLGETNRVSRYLQHFIHEENSHTYMLAEFCSKYYGRVMPEMTVPLQGPNLSRIGQDLLFFVRVYVFETFLDYLNRAAMADTDLEATARVVHRSHHLDESLHIAFDRAIITSLIARMQSEGLQSEIDIVGDLAEKYADYSMSGLVNPRIYRELGIAAPMNVALELKQADAWRNRADAWLATQRRFLRKVGVYK